MAGVGKGGEYERRRPELTVLYEAVQRGWPSVQESLPERIREEVRRLHDEARSGGGAAAERPAALRGAPAVDAVVANARLRPVVLQPELLEKLGLLTPRRRLPPERGPPQLELSM